jgi:hypothetical protein
MGELLYWKWEKPCDSPVGLPWRFHFASIRQATVKESRFFGQNLTFLTVGKAIPLP